MNIVTTRILLFFILVLLISACTHKSSLRKINPYQNIPLVDLNHWQLKARMAIRTPEDNMTASLNWQKHNENFDFHLSGSFGITYAHLIQTQTKATLEIPDHDLLIHKNAQLLMQQTLGWDFPIDALAYWVKGLPSYQQNEKIFRNGQGQIEHVELNNWQIDFSRYQIFQGYLLPKKIKAVHPQMTIKLIAKHWQFLES